MNYLTSSACASPSPSPSSLDGRALRHLDARQRACLGANILATPGPFVPTVSLLATILRVSVSYISAARKMSPAKRNAILAGIDNTSFVPLLNAPQARLALPAPKVADDIANSFLVDVVRTAGIERTLAAAVLVENSANGHANAA